MSPQGEIASPWDKYTRPGAGLSIGHSFEGCPIHVGADKQKVTGNRLSYNVLTAWMPHSVLARPRQRPARASSSGEVRLVQGMHPTERKPAA
jgi:hypothetical protein